MIRRLSAVVVLVVYLITSAGFAFNLHFCGSRVSSVSVNSFASSCCGKKVAAMKCCKDKKVEIRITGKALQIKSGINAPSSANHLIFNLPCASVFRRAQVNTSPLSPRIKGPPLATCGDILIQNCVFRI